MFEFESLGPIKVDCAGADDHIYVSFNRLNEERETTANKIVLLKKYRKMAERIKEMEVYDDDTWVITYPRSGTTWTQEMVWLLNNNLNFIEAKKVDLLQRFPYLELSGVLTRVPDDSEDIIFNLARPRHIKSHLNVDLLPDKLWSSHAKIIYVARNPKDVAISFYHHYKNLVGYAGAKEEFLDEFIDGRVIYAPFFDHVLSYWNLRTHKNVCFLMYEDMKRDLMSALKKISRFLGKSYTDKQLRELANHVSLQNMKKNPSCNMEKIVAAANIFNKNLMAENYEFIRKGEAGGYVNEMDDQYIMKFDKWTEESLKGTDFCFS